MNVGTSNCQKHFLMHVFQSGDFLYKKPEMIPRQLDGSEPGAVFQAVHRDPNATLYWHLDDSYLGQTLFIHQMRLAPPPGKHTATVVDGGGNSVSISFTIAESR